MAVTRTTIGDVARAAGVSKGTVSLAYSGKRPVSEDTRRRVFAAAEALHWTASPSARALATARTDTIGLVIARPPEILATDDFFARFIAGCEEVLSQKEIGLLLNIATTPEAETAMYERFAAGRADGVILLDVRGVDRRLDLVRELELPAVILTAAKPDPESSHGVSAVYTDDADAIAELVDLLVQAGHRRIAHVAGPLHYVHGESRRSAFVRTLTGHGLDAALIEEADFTAAAGRDATARLLDRPHPPTAIIYANDVMAISGLSLARSRGIHVPEQLSITGFDDDVLSAHLSPGLTTVATGADVRGEAAAHALIEMIEGGRPRTVHVDCTRVIRRGSTAPPPS